MVSASGVENCFILGKREFNKKKLQFSEVEFILDLELER